MRHATALEEADRQTIGVYQFPRGKEIMRCVFGRKNLPSIGPVLSVAPLSRTERVVKRASDIALAVTALVPLSPLMSMTALAIILD